MASTSHVDAGALTERQHEQQQHHVHQHHGRSLTVGSDGSVVDDDGTALVHAGDVELVDASFLSHGARDADADSLADFVVEPPSELEPFPEQCGYSAVQSALAELEVGGVTPGVLHLDDTAAPGEAGCAPLALAATPSVDIADVRKDTTVASSVIVSDGGDGGCRKRQKVDDGAVVVADGPTVECPASSGAGSTRTKRVPGRLDVTTACGKYQLTHLLGSGGQASVYCAERVASAHDGLAAAVAVKVLGLCKRPRHVLPSNELSVHRALTAVPHVIGCPVETRVKVNGVEYAALVRTRSGNLCFGCSKFGGLSGMRRSPVGPPLVPYDVCTPISWQMTCIVERVVVRGVCVNGGRRWLEWGWSCWLMSPSSSPTLTHRQPFRRRVPV